MKRVVRRTIETKNSDGVFKETLQNLVLDTTAELHRILLDKGRPDYRSVSVVITAKR